MKEAPFPLIILQHHALKKKKTNKKKGATSAKQVGVEDHYSLILLHS